MKRIFFHGMRHGTKSGDALTEFGIKQVVATALAFLVQVPLRRFYSSKMARAKQTAETVSRVLGYAGAEVVQLECFGFTGQVDGEELDWSGWADRMHFYADASSIREVFKTEPNPALVGKRMYAGMLEIIAELEKEAEADEVHVFFGSHGPTVETAIAGSDNNELDLPAAKVADLVSYTFRKQDAAWKMTSAKLKRCPLTLTEE